MSSAGPVSHKDRVAFWQPAPIMPFQRSFSPRSRTQAKTPTFPDLQSLRDLCEVGALLAHHPWSKTPVPQLIHLPEYQCQLQILFWWRNNDTPSNRASLDQLGSDPLPQDAIYTLLAIRRRNGIHSQSRVRIRACHSDLYVAQVGSFSEPNQIFRGVYVKLGPSMDLRGKGPPGEPQAEDTEDTEDMNERMERNIRRSAGFFHS
jgi:hypothetical protein